MKSGMVAADSAFETITNENLSSATQGKNHTSFKTAP